MVYEDGFGNSVGVDSTSQLTSKSEKKSVRLWLVLCCKCVRHVLLTLSLPTHIQPTITRSGTTKAEIC